MTVPAQGIHAHSVKKLGRRPEITSKPKILLRDVLASTAPTHPLADAGPDLDFPMDRNDQAGDCVVAGVNHALQVINHLLGHPYTPWTDAQLLAYYQTQNPKFHSWSDAGSDADGGMVIADFLSYLVKHGVILGFAKVDHKNTAELEAAVYLGLALVAGATLQDAQQSGDTWDYVPGSPDWGGHCTAQDGYSAAPEWETISWGSHDYRMTPAFMTHNVDEVYLVITQAHIDNADFRSGFDLNAFKAAFTQMTGRPWNATWGPTSPPTPTPTPTPVPTPPTPPNGGGDQWFQVGADVAAHVAAAAVRRNLSREQWLDGHLRHYFKMG